MANNPAIQGRSTPSTTSTLWTMILGWMFLRLVAGGTRRTAPAAGGRPAGGQGERSASGLPESGKQHASPEAAQAESGRGRHADTPTEIPAKGWKDVLWRVYEEIGKDRVMAVAAGVTYYALLAIFPAIAALVSIYGLFSDPATIQEHLNALSGMLPGGATEIIGEQVQRISSQGGGALGFGFIAGLAISLWSANAGMKAIAEAIESSINRVYRIYQKPL